ncbi:MAG: hypothetical protein ABJO30_00715 [Hyphomicrobiales bacterium]
MKDKNMDGLLLIGIVAFVLIINLKLLGINLSIFDDLANKEFLYYKRAPKRSGRRWGNDGDGGIGGYYGGYYGGDGGGDAGGGD